MSQYSITLWDSLKFEILNAQEPELADEALTTLEAIAVCLSKNQMDISLRSSLAQYLRPIAKECNEHLQEPTNRQAKAAGEILSRLCSANALTLNNLVKAVLPSSLTLYQDVGTIPKQRSLLEILNTLLESAISVLGTWISRESKSPSENTLEKFKDQLLEIYSQALMSTIREEVSFRCTAAIGLLRLSKLRDLLQENEIGLVVQYFDEILLKEDHFGEDDLKRLAMECIAEISKYKPRLIMDISFPAFIAQLPDTDLAAEANNDYITTLEGLAEISGEKELSGTLVRRLLNKVDVLLASENPGHPAYIRATLSSILFVLSRQELSSDSQLSIYYDRIAVGLIRRALLARVGLGPLTALNHELVLSVLGQLTNLIIRNLSLEKQSEIARNTYRLFTPELDEGNVLPSPESQAYYEKVVLSTWVLAALPREVDDPLFEKSNIQEHLLRLKDLVLHEGNASSKFMLIRQISLYMNKHINAAELDTATSMLDGLYHSLKGTSKPAYPDINSPLRNPPDTDMTSSPFDTPSAETSNAIRLVIAITSALTNRLAPSTTSDLDNLLTLLDLPNPLSTLAAHGFSSLLSADPILSPQNGYQIRKLVPQKVLSTLLPSIATGIRSSSTTTLDTSPLPPQQKRSNYLSALSSLLPHLPPSILLPYLDSLTPLLLQCLDTSVSNTTTNPLSGLTTFSSLIPLAGPSLASSGHLHSLITRLLTLTRPPQPLRTRILATSTLGMLPLHVKGDGMGGGERELIKEKGRVLRELVAGLDDRKREVRREAVKARGSWERGVGGEDEEAEE